MPVYTVFKEEIDLGARTIFAGRVRTRRARPYLNEREHRHAVTWFSKSSDDTRALDHNTNPHSSLGSLQYRLYSSKTSGTLICCLDHVLNRFSFPPFV